MSVLPLGESACEPARSVGNPDPNVKQFSHATKVRHRPRPVARGEAGAKFAPHLDLAATAPGVDSTGVAALE